MNLPGIKDSEFIRDKVPMTKEEIRILTLCKAKIRPEDIIWDVGAGTGSLSVEAARLATEGRVYAVEKKELGVEMIRTNGAKFQVADRMEVIHGEAPEALRALPPCSCALIGGSGRNTGEILDVIRGVLPAGGRIVANAITLQTVSIIAEYFRAHKEEFDYEIVQVQVNRVKQIASYDMYEAQNPIFIITAIKRGEA